MSIHKALKSRATALVILVAIVCFIRQVLRNINSSSKHQTSLTTAGMAWISSGSTNKALVSNLVTNKLITSDRVKNAMLGVRRPPYFCDQYIHSWSITSCDR